MAGSFEITSKIIKVTCTYEHLVRNGVKWCEHAVGCNIYLWSNTRLAEHQSAHIVTKVSVTDESNHI